MDLVSQSVFLKTLGWSLLHSLWQMAALWLLYFIITAGGRRFTASVRHIILVSLLGAGMLCFVFSIFISYGSQADLPAAQNSNALFFTAGAYSLLSMSKQAVNVLLPYCSLIYIAVLVFMMVRYSKYYLQCRRLKLNGLHKASPALRLFVEDVAAQLGIRKKVTLWLSEVADSPLTIGFLKSVILIPLATINQLSVKQVEAILLHELAHIKRNDYFLNLWLTFTGILFFFNPFSRLLIQHIRKEAENSCDDLVMQFRYDPHTYVSALLSLERTRHQLQLAMAAVGRNNQVLLERVRRIAGQKNSFQYHPSKLIVCFLFGVAICLSVWYHPVEQATALNKQQQASPPAKSIATGERQRAGYVQNTLSIAASKTGKTITVTVQSDTHAIKGSVHHELKSSISFVRNDEGQDEVNAAMNIMPVSAPEQARDYSIQGDPDPVVPPPPPVNIFSHPFVPNSSFSFKIIQDSSSSTRHNKTDNEESLISSAMQKALHAIDVVDWKALDQKITGATTRTEIERLQNELRRSLRALELQHNEDVLTEDDADELRVKENIQLQLQALANNKLKTAEEIQKLKQQLQQGKIKLFQQNMKKLNENLKEIEAIRKKSKIIYI